MITNIDYFYRRGKSPCVVMLHGWGLNKNAYDKVVQNINKNNSILTLDFCGFGNSPEPNNYYDTYEYAYHIFLLLKKLDIDNVVLVGHSFGGRVSIILSSVFKIKIKNLILTSSAGINKFNLIKSLKILKFKVLKMLAKFKLFSYKKLSAYGSNDYKLLNTKMRNIFVKIVNQDLRFLLRKILCSTYLVWDKKDTVTPYLFCKIFNRLIFNSKTLIYQNGNHFTYMINSKKFAFLINDLISCKLYNNGII